MKNDEDRNAITTAIIDLIFIIIGFILGIIMRG